MPDNFVIAVTISTCIIGSSVLFFFNVDKSGLKVTGKKIRFLSAGMHKNL